MTSDDQLPGGGPTAWAAANLNRELQARVQKPPQPDYSAAGWEARRATMKKARNRRRRLRQLTHKIAEEDFVSRSVLDEVRALRAQIAEEAAPQGQTTRLGGRRCHYCGGPGETRDHIVPRARLARPHEPADARTTPRGRIHANIVVCCHSCNTLKGDSRSDCECQVCIGAWESYGPQGWRDAVPVVVLVGLPSPWLRQSP